MTNRIAVVGLCTLLITTPLLADSNPTYRFLRGDVSARAAALGGSFVTMQDDPNGIFYNPSVLASLTQPQLSIGFFKHLLDINAGHASYATEVRDLGFVGTGISYIHYGEFTRTDQLGNRLGTFGANELALSVGYGSRFEYGLLYGANVKFIYSSIADVSSSAMALDFGVLYALEDPQWTFGASLLNLGTQLDPYFTTRENLPLDFKIGATVRPEHLPLLLNLNFHRLNESQDDFVKRFRAFSLGGEFIVSEMVRLRFGYNNERRRELKIGPSAGMAGLSFGAGVQIDMYRLDYAFNSYGKVGQLHRLSLSFAFGSL